MKNKKWKITLAVSILLLATSACNPVVPQSEPTASPAPTVAPPQPTFISPTQPSENSAIPQTEADVPRISVEDAKAAFDNGEAIIVDVRNADAYNNGHAKGAINIPLGLIETDLANVPLQKDQWIVTYCT